MSETIEGMPRVNKLGRGRYALAADALVCPVSVWIAFSLRLDGLVPFDQPVQIATVVALAIALPTFYFSNLYRVILSHVTWNMMLDIVRAVLIYAVLYALIFTVLRVPGVPRSIGLLQPILLFLGVGCSRAIVGYWIGGGQRRNGNGRPLKSVLIYGAGASGRQLASSIAYSGQLRVVGFVDDNPDLQGRRLGGVTIYDPGHLSTLLRSLGVQEVLLALPSASRARRSEIVKALQALHVPVRTVPGIMDLANGVIQFSDVRPLKIEDLLGRDVVAPDRDLLRADVAGKTVLVTGAGGSIGSELCRQILNVGPATLLLVESSEYALYAVHQDLIRLAHRSGSAVSIIPLLASVRDELRLSRIVGTWRPNTIYHAAAYKHVPLVEHNPVEGVQNNVFGTLTAARVAAAHRVDKFVLISTDKAVRPTNVMGTSKRIAELVLQAMADRGGATCFTMVRFGNVLGSSGSVVPLFRQQIADGGPITITHNDITRYFMTIPEAAQLVIQAGAMAQGGEVFVLDMGEPVRIRDLAVNMIELSGLSLRDASNPDGDIEIRETGLRPGEKLYEELLIGDNPEQTTHPRIMKTNEHYFPLDELERELAKLDQALAMNDLVKLKESLKYLVPEYSAPAKVVDHVSARLEMEACDR
jgi:FlaA1/EpsC-like NDP-sugar epimerase